MIVNIIFWSSFVLLLILGAKSIIDMYIYENTEYIGFNRTMISIFSNDTTSSVEDVLHNEALRNSASKLYIGSNDITKQYKLYRQICHAINNAQLQNSKHVDSDLSYLAKVQKVLNAPDRDAKALCAMIVSFVLMSFFLSFADNSQPWIIKIGLSIIGFLIVGYYFYATSIIKTHYLIRKYKGFDISNQFDEFEFENTIVNNKVFKYAVLNYRRFLYNVDDFSKLRKSINRKSNSLIDNSSIAVFNSHKSSMEAQGDWQNSVIYLNKVCKDKDYMKDFLLNDSDSANKQIVYDKLISSIDTLYAKLSELDKVLDSLLKVQDKKRIAKAYAKGNIEQLTNEEKTDYFSKM